MLSMRRQSRMAAGAGLSAGVRLMRLELLATRQAQALLAAERQITKLNTRARLLGKDLQPPLRQVGSHKFEIYQGMILSSTQSSLGALHMAVYPPYPETTEIGAGVLNTYIVHRMYHGRSRTCK